MRHLFILNKFAGVEDTTERLKAKIEKLDVDGEKYIEYTQCHRDCERIVKEYLEKSDDFLRVYACGGDGTANEVAQPMVGKTNCAMAVVPVGTGNDFVRSLPSKPEDLLDFEKLVEAPYRRINVIKCEDMYSINSCTAGYDCEVAEKAQDFKRWPLMTGSLAYKLSIFYCLITKRKHSFKAKLDDELISLPQGYETPMLTVAANGKFYGGGIKCSPMAKLDDNLIDFMIIPTIPIPKFVGLLSTFIKGEHIDNPKMPFIFHTKCKKLQLIDDKEVKVGVDGEIMRYNNPTITIIDDALNIIIP